MGLIWTAYLPQRQPDIKTVQPEDGTEQIDAPLVFCWGSMDEREAIRKVLETKPQEETAEADKRGWTERAQALFHDAYEHPGKTVAYVAGGAVALSGMALAGKSLLARTAAREVLLIEDTPMTGKALKSLLEKEGHNVTWFTGVKSFHPFTGITPEGKIVVFDPRKFRAALVDGELNDAKNKPLYLQGVHIVDALSKERLPIIGISTVPAENALLRANGALVSAEKPTALAAIAGHRLDLMHGFGNRTGFQASMDNLSSQLKGVYEKGAVVPPQVKRMHDDASKALIEALQ